MYYLLITFSTQTEHPMSLVSSPMKIIRRKLFSTNVWIYATESWMESSHLLKSIMPPSRDVRSWRCCSRVRDIYIYNRSIYFRLIGRFRLYPRF